MSILEVDRFFSYGGGVQSTAALVLAAKRTIDFPVFVFANVGEDSESPETMEYIESHARPFAIENGIELAEVRKRLRGGEEPTLLEWATKPDRSMPLPLKLSPSGAPGNRTCTSEFKIKPIRKELERRGATVDQPVVLGMGISVDELERMRTDRPNTPYTVTYPLVDLLVTRAECRRIIEQAGLPIPSRSACFFCPFHKREHFSRMSRDQPELFYRVERLEERMIEKRAAIGQPPVFLDRSLLPISDVVSSEQTELFEDDGECDGGTCFT